MESEEEKMKLELMQSIGERVSEYAAKADLEKNAPNLLERNDPAKVAKVLYLYSTGHSQTAIRRKYGVDRDSVVRILADYADEIGQWRQLGGKLAGYAYMHMASLEEQLIEKIGERLDSGELVPEFKDLKELSIAKANASREALTARGEASSIVEERRKGRDEDYEEMIKRAREKMREEAIDVDE